MNGEFAVTNYIMTTIDFIHQDHSRSEPKRRLIAYDPAHPVYLVFKSEGRGLHFIQGVHRPQALTVDIT